MEQFSLWEMFEVIGNLVLSSPLFIVTFVVGVILLIALIISIKKNRKVGRPLAIVTWIFLILFVIIRYNNYLYNLFDNLVNNVFMQIFFPNLATYIITLVTASVILIVTVISRNSPLYLKIINLIVPFVMIFVFFLTLDIIVKGDIDIYEKLTVYSNKNLLILIEFNMIIFVVWLFVLFGIKIVRLLIRKSDNKLNAEFLDSGDGVEVLKL